MMRDSPVITKKHSSPFPMGLAIASAESRFPDLGGDIAVLTSDISLACAKLRKILASLLWNFHIELMPSSRNWLKEQQQYLLWKRGPLNVRLSRRTVKVEM